MERENERAALITGGSRGLGFVLAEALARRGWRVVIDGRDEEALEAARVRLDAYGDVTAVGGDVAHPGHRRLLVEASAEAGGLDLAVMNASLLGPSPQPPLLDYPLAILEHVYRVNVLAPLGLLQVLRPYLKPGARVVNVTSDAAREPYEGWGGYGSSKAALDQLSAVLAVENPDLRIYSVDPGDLRTRMRQEAYPGEDISDRPLPESVVPGFLTLIEGDLPSGRYAARELIPAEAVP
jgi:NAD(P)-dependent dehydrogenase (short-subunit alcohol dehydrogenase family)